MHELSIAQALVAIVTEHAGDRRVTRVNVEVGHLRQVVRDALSFSFGLVAEGTVAEGAELVLIQIRPRAIAAPAVRAAHCRASPFAVRRAAGCTLRSSEERSCASSRSR